MKFEEVKRRYDYSFNSSVEDYIHDIRTGEFMDWTEFDNEDGQFNHGIAVLEIGYVDIELNLNSPCTDDGYYVNQTYPCYFVCVKGYNKDWGPAGYLDEFGIEVSVDWWADDWESQLERDMFNKLMEAVKKFDLKINEPNWTEPGHEFDVFDRINKMEVKE